MENSSNTFLIFTDQVIKNSFQINKKDLTNFFGAIGSAKYGTIFLPENRDGFFEKMETLVIQLDYPVMLNIGDVMENGRISSELLENIINFRKVKIDKGVVIAGHEEDFLSFDENFDFVLVNPTPPIPAVNPTRKYQVVNKLSDVLGLVSNSGK